MANANLATSNDLAEITGVNLLPDSNDDAGPCDVYVMSDDEDDKLEEEPNDDNKNPYGILGDEHNQGNNDKQTEAEGNQGEPEFGASMDP
jgi:hypothetical protein